MFNNLGKKRFFLLMCFYILSNSLSSQLRINEWMASNVDVLMDDLYDFPDSWVELYNSSDEPVNLNGWYIGSKSDYQKCWRLAVDTIIPPHGNLLVYCDKEKQGLHTHFRLETTQTSALYLYNPTGVLVDEVLGIPAQPAPNISMGRSADGALVWYVEATPGAKNSTQTATRLTPSPQFSIRAGIYQKPFTLTLSDTSGIAGARIHYTVDHSEPDHHSPLYTAPLTIDTTTVVRAKVIADGYLVPRSEVKTYILTDRELTLPVISISTDNRYLWDDTIGIYCVGTNGTSDGSGEPANFWWNWRRPMNLAFFPNQYSEEVLNQLGEMRIAGGGSRKYPIKSFITYSHKRFGKKEFAYPIFQQPDKQHVIIKSMMLRNSGQDWGITPNWGKALGFYFNDAANQLLMGGKVDLDYQAYQPAILYLNGEYRGIINLRERSEEDFIYGKYNRLENVDVIEFAKEVHAGDSVAYMELFEKIGKEIKTYDQLSDMIDMPEFINFLILHVFVGNTDFPARNVVMWRERKEGAKWRFIVKDTDLGGANCISPVINMIDFLMNGSNYNPENESWLKKTSFFRSIIQMNGFKEDFVRYFSVYLGDILKPEITHQLIDSLKQVLEQEMPYHLNKWGTQDIEAWNQKIEKKKEWLSSRIAYQYQHLNDYMGYGGLVDLKIEKPTGDLNELIMQLNGIDLQTNQFDGKYYKGQSFKLAWKGKPSDFKKWKVSIFNKNQTEPVLFIYDTPIIEIAVKEPMECIRVQPLTDYISQLDDIDSTDWTIIKESKGVRISGLTESGYIQVYDLSGNLIDMRSTNGEEIWVPLSVKGGYLFHWKGKGITQTRKVIY